MAASTATGNRLMAGVQIRTRERFFLLHNVQTSSGSHLASSPMDIRALFDYSPQSVAEVKNGGTKIQFPYMSSKE
jgi:hypothetical protein